MKKVTKYNKKIRVGFIFTAIIMVALLAAVFPWFSLKKDNIVHYYEMIVNGQQVGVVNSAEDAEKLYLDARLELQQNEGNSLYLDAEYNIEEKTGYVCVTDSDDTIKKNIYDVLSLSVVSVDEAAYEVGIDGKTYVLSTLEDVSMLLNASKEKYDENKLFHVEVSSSNSRFSSFTYNMVKAETEGQTAGTVMSTPEGEIKPAESSVAGNNIIGMEFSENIKIASTVKSSSEIMPVEEAISDILKEKEENQIYTVVKGDTLSGIAKRFGLSLKTLLAMNELTEKDYIHIGDEIIVTVPTPELSVIVNEKQYYTEEYNADVQYVYNKKKYSTYTKVISQGTTGTRDVVALVRYQNGVEVSRDIVESVITKESTAKVVEVGTLTPPKYIKPITGGKVTSGFGYRTFRGTRSFHKGVDWGIATGTSVRAAAAGKVIEAGWGGSYGYYVLIQHVDGSKTRYAHLSKILVSVGKTVSQNQKIALSGNTGNSTGPHLHFEIIINGSVVNPFKYVSR